VVQPIKVHLTCPPTNKCLTDSEYRGLLTIFALVFHEKKENFLGIHKMVKKLDTLFKRTEGDTNQDKFHGWLHVRQLLLQAHPEVQDLYRKVTNQQLPPLQEQDLEPAGTLGEYARQEPRADTSNNRFGQNNFAKKNYNPFEDESDRPDLNFKGKNTSASTRYTEATMISNMHVQSPTRVLPQQPVTSTNFIRKLQPEAQASQPSGLVAPPGLGKVKTDTQTSR